MSGTDTSIAGDYSDTVNFNVSSYYETRTIVLDCNGGDVNGESQIMYTVRDGSTYGQLPVPSKNGYRFNSWIDENGNSIYSGSTVDSSTEKLTAKWYQEFTFAANSTINGKDNSYFRNCGQATLYINGEKYTDIATFLYADKLTEGTKFKLDNIRASNGYTYIGLKSATGTDFSYEYYEDGSVKSVSGIFKNSSIRLLFEFESSSDLQNLIRKFNLKSIVIDTDIPKNVTSNESLNLFESNVNYYVDGETLYIYNPNGGKVIAKSDSKALFSSLTIENIDASGLDVSNCTSLEDVFSSDYYLKNLNISNWDVSNCVNMHALFSDCTNLESLDIKNWNTKNVSIADGMFSYMSNLNDLNCISEWDMSSLHSASNMFAGCSKIANIDITNWNTNNLTYANGMFWNMKGLITLDVSNLNLSKCTNIGYTFGGLYSLKEFKGLENLDVSNVAYAQAAFADLFNLENIDLPSFNCDKLIYTKEMFSDCYKLKSLNLKKFHLASKMTDISYMFNRCKSLENIYVSNESVVICLQVIQLICFLVALPL